MNDKLKHKIIKYLNKEYSGLVRYETDIHPDYTFFMKDGKLIFDYNKENSCVYISYKHIWSFLTSFFGLEYEEIQSLTKEWVEELFKMEVATTQGLTNHSFKRVEELFKMEVATTSVARYVPSDTVEELFKMEMATTCISRNHKIG